MNVGILEVSLILSAAIGKNAEADIFITVFCTTEFPRHVHEYTGTVDGRKLRSATEGSKGDEKCGSWFSSMANGFDKILRVERRKYASSREEKRPNFPLR